MTSTTTRIITITLATLALAAPAAGAMPIRDDEGMRSSSPAGTPAPKQDMRNPDQQAPAPPVPLKPIAPVVPTKPAPVADDGGLSPLAFIVPSLALLGLLGAAVIHTRASRPARV